MRYYVLAHVVRVFACCLLHMEVGMFISRCKVFSRIWGAYQRSDGVDWCCRGRCWYNTCETTGGLYAKFCSRLFFDRGVGSDIDWSFYYYRGLVGEQLGFKSSCHCLCETVFFGSFADGQIHCYWGDIPLESSRICVLMLSMVVLFCWSCAHHRSSVTTGPRAYKETMTIWQNLWQKRTCNDMQWIVHWISQAFCLTMTKTRYIRYCIVPHIWETCNETSMTPPIDMLIWYLLDCGAWCNTYIYIYSIMACCRSGSTAGSRWALLVQVAIWFLKLHDIFRSEAVEAGKPWDPKTHPAVLLPRCPHESPVLCGFRRFVAATAACFDGVTCQIWGRLGSGSLFNGFMGSGAAPKKPSWFTTSINPAEMLVMIGLNMRLLGHLRAKCRMKFFTNSWCCVFRTNLKLWELRGYPSCDSWLAAIRPDIKYWTLNYRAHVVPNSINIIHLLINYNSTNPGIPLTQITE